MQGTRPVQPLSSDELLERLSALGIIATTHTHPAVMTVEESKRMRGDIEGAHAKNLFLKDKKKNLWLVVAVESHAVDLKDLKKRIGSAGLSFGRAEVLFEVLGVTPGSVTPFAVVNDTAGKVTVVLDRALAEASQVNVHPLINTRTTTLDGAGLLAFLQAENHDPVIVDFSPSEA